MNTSEDRTTRLTLGQAIRYVRERKGMSARALSQTAGLSAAYVSKVERGEMEPSLKAFGRLAIVLEMTEAEVNLLVRLHANEVDE